MGTVGLTIVVKDGNICYIFICTNPQQWVRGGAQGRSEVLSILWYPVINDINLNTSSGWIGSQVKGTDN